MRALCPFPLVRTGARILNTYQANSRCATFPFLPTASSASSLSRASYPGPVSRLQRTFSHASSRSNNWRDPRRRDPHEELARARPLFTSDGLSRFVRSPGLRTVVVLSMASALIFYYLNLETVPVSGRRRFNCFSEAKVREASEAQARLIEWELQQKGHHFLPAWDWRTRLVKRVMDRLIPFSGMEDAQWEVRVIDDPRTANAFVLPGGKVFVYSGLIPIARTDDGMAAVLGHEIAHNLAEHVAERMSSQIGINILLYSLIFLTGGIAIMGTSYIGSAVLNLIFSRPMDRRQESEADYIGLMMMAEACYDPQQALGFWERMKRLQKSEPPEWMNTHPSNDNRIQKIQEWMPEALDKMNQSDCQGTATFASLFKQALEGRTFMQRRDNI
ncbi:peptidase family M48-domain-containing protein [Xylaria sp. CBS 124048]|nr:peptidase family M48-domain-containing protein [Xylaria sp. CBS 124048]